MSKENKYKYFETLPKENYIYCFKSKGQSWIRKKVSMFLKVKNRWIKEESTGYSGQYSFYDKEMTKPHFDRFFLDFDADNEEVELAINEALMIQKLLSKFNINSVAIKSGGKGAHLHVYPPERFENITIDQAKALHSIFYNFIKENYHPKYLCESCKKPIKKAVRIPYTQHENGCLCEIIDTNYNYIEFDNNKTSLTKILIERFQEEQQEEKLKQISKEYKKKYIEYDNNFNWDKVNLIECISEFTTILSNDGGKYRIIHPDHPQTKSKETGNGYVNEKFSYSFSTDTSYNIIDTLTFYLGDKSTVMNYLQNKYKK
jgi:hypothetical protein